MEDEAPAAAIQNEFRVAMLLMFQPKSGFLRFAAE